MKAVLRHELSSHFTNLTSYVFGAFILLFAGIFSMVINLQSGLTNFEYVLSNMAFVFLLAVPILTMRILAEERRQKTDQLLYSLPISMTQVVLGKFVALLILLLVPVAIIGVYPLILSAYGNVYMPAAYGALVGFFFLGAALIAIGMYISSITESQAIAAGLCFVVMLANFYLATLAGYIPNSAIASLLALSVLAAVFAVIIRVMTRSSFTALLVGVLLEAGLLGAYIYDSTVFEGLFANIVDALSLYERFYVFVDGIFDVTAIVYFITVIGIFLFLSVQSLEKRRWSE